MQANEEIFARGYLQGLLRHHFGSGWAVFGSALVFASMHLLNQGVLQNPVPLLNLFLAGILLGVSREASGGLWLPMGIHLTWNFMQGNVYGFAVSGLATRTVLGIKTQGPAWLSGSVFRAEGSLIATVVLLGAAAAESGNCVRLKDERSDLRAAFDAQ